MNFYKLIPIPLPYNQIIITFSILLNFLNLGAKFSILNDAQPWTNYFYMLQIKPLHHIHKKTSVKTLHKICSPHYENKHEINTWHFMQISFQSFSALRLQYFASWSCDKELRI